MSVKPSFSALDQFLNCERQFYFARILKLEREPSHYLAIGGLGHEVLADAAIGNRVDVRSKLARHKELTEWKSDVPDDVLVRQLETILERVRKEVLPYLDVAAVEQWYRTPYLAKIDLLSNTTPLVDAHGKIVGKVTKPCVIDWKFKFSSRSRRDQESTDHSAQLALYCLQTGADTAAFVEIPREGGPTHTLVTNFSAYDLVYWRRYLDSQFAAVASRGEEEAAYRLAPAGHPLCRPQFCTFWRRCPGGGGEHANS